MARQKKGEILELSVESIGFEGKAVARHEDLVYFVNGGVPGDIVRAEVRRKRRRHREAQVVEVLKASEHRREARCSYFGECGGCKWQHLDYQEQVRWKKHHVRDAFERLGKIPYGTLLDTLTAEDQFFYRNKMEFSFSHERWFTREMITSGRDLRREFALGLHVPGRFDKVLDIEECFLQSPLSNRLLNAVREAALARGTSAYNPREHAGFLRNLVIRTSVHRPETMVILVCSPPADVADAAMAEWFRKDLPQAFPEVTTLILAETDSKASVAVGKPQVVYGPGYINEELLGVEYRISPFSFFQTNTRQAERLFEKALDYANLQADQTVWDLYCGAGSISLCAAPKVKQVVGIEIVESSILDARANAARNGISNAAFHCEDMLKAASSRLLERLPKPDTIIVDPPRAGMHPDVVRLLPDFGAETIVYVSCNPATQARDCALLAEHYAVDLLQPVDMFPNTYHIESIARLRRKPV